MRNMLAEQKQPKRIAGLKAKSWRDIIIITFIASLVIFVAVSAKAETTEEVIKEQVAIHQENTKEIEELKEKQQKDEEFIKTQAEINQLEAEWRNAQEVYHMAKELKEEIKK